MPSKPMIERMKQEKQTLVKKKDKLAFQLNQVKANLKFIEKTIHEYYKIQNKGD